MYTVFAVVDIETTGLDPHRGHRIIEIAVVHVEANLVAGNVWDTLVNPDHNIGPSEVHGLHLYDVEGAPRFAEIAGAVLDLLEGRILVAHNARFDVGFLAAEYRRLNLRFAPSALCTLELAHDLDLPTRLCDCCDCLGVKPGEGHAAFVDAQAVAALLPQLLVRARDAGHPLQFSEVGRLTETLERSGRRLPRVEPFLPSTRTYVASLIRRLDIVPTGGVHTDDHAAFAYADVLDRALSDRILTEEETQHLQQIASELALSVDQVNDIHLSYLTALAGIALADGILSRDERADLARVAKLLNIEAATIEDVLAGAASAVRHLPAMNRSAGFNLAIGGETVCFLGEPISAIRGRPVLRTEAELIAAAAGLVIARRLTPAVDIAVVTDPVTQTARVDRARELGVQVVAERVFWPTLGVQVD
jgi:DNA polymerase-3 subunit epsilon